MSISLIVFDVCIFHGLFFLLRILCFILWSKLIRLLIISKSDIFNKFTFTYFTRVILLTIRPSDYLKFFIDFSWNQKVNLNVFLREFFTQYLDITFSVFAQIKVWVAQNNISLFFRCKITISHTIRYFRKVGFRARRVIVNI